MSDKAVTHQFKDCTIDLRGAGYACVSRGDEFEIGHTGEGDRVLIEGDTLDFTGLHILGPVALADRIKAAVALECYAMATERDALRAEIARLTAERDAALAGAVKVKPLVWECVSGSRLIFDAVGFNSTYRLWVQLDGSAKWQARYAGDWIDAPNPEAAKAAAQADYDASILAAIQPDPDARQADLAKAWMMATAAMAERAKSELSAAWAADLIVQWAQSLTPPADLAAKIGGE